MSIASKNITENLSFDAWGRRRNPDNWSYTLTDTTFFIDRGYTMHQHYDALGVINMNGRVYDPVLGQMLSPDCLIADPTNPQDYNRYSYCNNNPLKYTDPSGWKKMTLDEFMKEAAKGAGGTWKNGEATLFQDEKDAVDYINNNNIFGGYFQIVLHEKLRYNGKSWILNLGGGRKACFNSRKTAIQFMSRHKMISYIFIEGKNKEEEEDPSGQGGMPGWASDVNTGINAFGVANSAKTELIDYAVRSNYKSARTWSEFNNLRSSQQAWRTTNTLGKTGAIYLKYAKGLGYVGAGLTTTYSAANAGMYYYNGGTDWQVGTKATLDVIMTGVGFLGPIGFGVSASYFILDATTGGFGGFGQIKP